MNGLVKYGLNKLNYTYFIVDEPCFTGRAADGTLLENKTTWPTGLKAFGAELRSHGMKLGICVCVLVPLSICPTVAREPNTAPPRHLL
jgi:hypothetical protein